MADEGVRVYGPSKHFLNPEAHSSSVKPLPGSWLGIPVVWDRKNKVLAIIDDPEFYRKMSGIVKAGTPFIPLSPGIPILGKVKKTETSFEAVERAIKGGPQPVEVKDLREKVQRSWWVSAATVDPLHILIDWDGESTIQGLKSKVEDIILRG